MRKGNAWRWTQVLNCGFFAGKGAELQWRKTVTIMQVWREGWTAKKMSLMVEFVVGFWRGMEGRREDAAKSGSMKGEGNQAKNRGAEGAALVCRLGGSRIGDAESNGSME